MMQFCNPDSASANCTKKKTFIMSQNSNFIEKQPASKLHFLLYTVLRLPQENIQACKQCLGILENILGISKESMGCILKHTSK